LTALATAFDALTRVQPVRIVGTVTALRGLTVLVDDLPVPVGSLVSIGSSDAACPARAFGEVVGFTREHAIIMLLGQTTGIRPGDQVTCEEVTQTAAVGPRMLGRVVDGLARPIDDKGPIRDTIHLPISPEPIRALRRRRITQPLYTGIRAIDLMTTLGRGQRMGLFAGPGVGKSTLLGTIAKRTSADVNVIALIGERGREVKEFVEHSLGAEGMTRSVVVVATGDESPLLRLRAAKLACTAAEYFRSRGLDVLLMMDSITRFAQAQRQVGLSVGEPPATKGYTPSVFSNMALLLERAGAIEADAHPRASEPANQGRAGSITGLYTILVEGDDMTEPIADAARGILDGHIILSRKLAQKSHYPAIDVLDSVSRVQNDVTTPEHGAARRQWSKLLATYREVEDLVQIGAYARGSNPDADVAIDCNRAINDILRQGSEDNSPFEKSLAAMQRISKESTEAIARSTRSKR
jgi:flagellum-specific ATP synthase